MRQLLNRVQQHLNENTAVEAEDIQALVDFAELYNPKTMKVDRLKIKENIEDIVGNGVIEGEEIDITTDKIMEEIDLLIKAIER